MERRHIPEKENKLVILYALQLLGPVTGMQLIQFLAEMDLMNYFTMQLSLSDMEDQGQITRHAHPLGGMLEPTQEGLFTLRSFTSRIPRSRRVRMDKEAPMWRERFRAEQMAPAEVLDRTGGILTLRLRLLEGASVLMDVLLAGRDLPDAYIEKRWQQAAQSVYQQVIAALTEDFTEDAPVAPGQHASLQQASRAEWLLTLQDTPDAPTLTLLLTLPDEHLARYCLSRWDNCCLNLRSSIVKAILDAQV